MSFQRYPKYKDSNVEWLSEVPEQWHVQRLKELLAEVDERAEDLDLELLGLSKSLGVLKRSQIEQGASESDNYAKYKVAVTGQLVMNKMQAWNGVFGICPCHGMVSPDYAVYRFTIREFDLFLCSLFRTELMAGVFFTRCRGMGTAFLRLNTQDFLDIKVPIPPKDYVHLIIKFIDIETNKINVLVAEQQRLIKLLQEKREAVISHAVTKGLNPHAPMKDSGIKWLGLVPKHWSVAKLSRLTTRIGDGLHGTPEYVDESDYRFINGNNLVDGSILLQDTTRCVNELEFQKHRVELNNKSLLLSINGTIGNLALYNCETVILGKSAAYVNCGNMIIREFLYWFLQSSFMKWYFEYAVTGTTIFNLSLDSIRSIPVALPSLEEQSAIIADLFARDKQYKDLIHTAQRSIDLLQERRSVLISAAVTGKIDVRGIATSDVA